MSEFSTGEVEKRTNMLGLYSQIVTAFGFIVIVLGAIYLVRTLIQEFSGQDGAFQEGEVMSSTWVLLSGLGLTAFGSGLAALRTIAVNCARIADK